MNTPPSEHVPERMSPKPDAKAPSRRAFLRIAGGGVVLAATGAGLTAFNLASGIPPDAVQAWNGPSAEEADPRRWALSYALLAPHSHNLQSWVADLSEPNAITLRCDLQRLLPETDPQSRQIMMSHGGFIELLVMAAAARGQRAEVTLFPQGEFDAQRIDARPVAHVRLQPQTGISADPLFAHVLRRHTNRLPYEPQAPSAQAISAISAELNAPGLRGGVVTEPAALPAHRALAREAWRIEMVTPAAVMESTRWLRVGPSEIAQHRDGLSINQPMLRVINAVGLLDRTQPPAPDGAVVARQLADFDELIAATPAFLWLVSQAAGRGAQIAAGRAYVRAQLAATAQGLHMQPLSQALQEYPEQAEPYRQAHALMGARDGEVVQMWARLGRGPTIGPSPRRGLDALLA